jgi:hypothetical protein
MSQPKESRRCSSTMRRRQSEERPGRRTSKLIRRYGLVMEGFIDIQCDESVFAVSSVLSPVAV